MMLDEAIDRLYDLHSGTTPVEEGSPHERPHKPLMILAALDLIDEGKAAADRIPWCRELRDRFTARFLLVRMHNDQNTPENPFRYLQSEGFWQAWMEENGNRLPLRSPPLVNQIGSVFACFTGGLEHLVSVPETRRKLREALLSRYFPGLAAAALPASDTPVLMAKEDGSPDYGRSPAFRRIILEIYDHQCAACGLRIRLPTGNDVSFIDAAHLVPFSQSRNDHPTNGLALCKNHHWAMDRNIIAPGPDRIWHVSRVLDPRRSTGEKELASLDRTSLLLPKDPAFHPAERGLAWRIGKLADNL